jgi:hypothetical protein
MAMEPIVHNRNLRQQEAKLKENKDDFSKTIVSLSFVLLIIYTIAVLIIFAKTGLEPETMTKYFVGAIIGEFGFLSGIKVTKEIREWRKKEEHYNETNNHADA